MPTLSQFQAEMWQKVGLVRDAENLRQAVRMLEDWAQAAEEAATETSQQSISSESARRQMMELANLTRLGWLMAQAALTRTESRGGHFRRDYPTAREHWRQRIVFTRPVPKLLAGSRA